MHRAYNLPVSEFESNQTAPPKKSKLVSNTNTTQPREIKRAFNLALILQSTPNINNQIVINASGDWATISPTTTTARGGAAKGSGGRGQERKTVGKRASDSPGFAAAKLPKESAPAVA